MPVLSWAHSAYWSGAAAGNINPPIGAAGGVSYTPWMTTITVTSLLFLASKSWAPR